MKQLYPFKSTKKLHNLWASRNGEHDDYIQILEYIPFESADSSTPSNGNIPWVNYRKQIGLILLCTLKPDVKLTQHQVLMSPGKRSPGQSRVEYFIEYFEL